MGIRPFDLRFLRSDPTHLQSRFYGFKANIIRIPDVVATSRLSSSSAQRGTKMGNSEWLPRNPCIGTRLLWSSNSNVKSVYNKTLDCSSGPRRNMVERRRYWKIPISAELSL